MGSRVGVGLGLGLGLGFMVCYGWGWFVLGLGSGSALVLYLGFRAKGEGLRRLLDCCLEALGCFYDFYLTSRHLARIS